MFTYNLKYAGALDALASLNVLPPDRDYGYGKNHKPQTAPF